MQVDTAWGVLGPFGHICIYLWSKWKTSSSKHLYSPHEPPQIQACEWWSGRRAWRSNQGGEGPSWGFGDCGRDCSHVSTVTSLVFPSLTTVFNISFFVTSWGTGLWLFELWLTCLLLLWWHQGEDINSWDVPIKWKWERSKEGVEPVCCLTPHQPEKQWLASVVAFFFARQHHWIFYKYSLQSVQFSSVPQLCLTLCDPMDHSTPGLPVYHQLLEFTQTHVHWVGDAIQSSHPLSSPSPPAPNPSQHQGLFQWVSSSHQVAKGLEFQLQHQPFQWTTRTDLL